MSVFCEHCGKEIYASGSGYYHTISSRSDCQDETGAKMRPESIATPATSVYRLLSGYDLSTVPFKIDEIKIMEGIMKGLRQAIENDKQIKTLTSQVDTAKLAYDNLVASREKFIISNNQIQDDLEKVRVRLVELVNSGPAPEIKEAPIKDIQLGREV